MSANGIKSTNGVMVSATTSNGNRKSDTISNGDRRCDVITNGTTNGMIQAPTNGVAIEENTLSTNGASSYPKTTVGLWVNQKKFKKFDKLEFDTECR